MGGTRGNGPTGVKNNRASTFFLELINTKYDPHPINSFWCRERTSSKYQNFVWQLPQEMVGGVLKKNDNKPFFLNC